MVIRKRQPSWLPFCFLMGLSGCKGLQMTLIIAGHHYRQGIQWPREGIDSSTPLVLDGLFFASDSIITSGQHALLGGFRKVYPLTARLWKPYFLDRYFHSYREVISQVECALAFAGSTLTAQHVLNTITEHLEKLRVSYRRALQPMVPGDYVVALHCQEAVLSRGAGTWDEDMFLPSDIEGLLTAEAVSDAVLYSINEALRSARRYKLDKAGFESLYTEFAFGLRCPVSKEYRLYCFRIQRRDVDGAMEVFTEKEEIQPGKLAVLGRVADFGVEAQTRYEAAIASGQEPATLMFDFLNEAIDRSLAAGRRDIDRPSSLKVLSGWTSLKKKKFIPAD